MKEKDPDRHATISIIRIAVRLGIRLASLGALIWVGGVVASSAVAIHGEHARSVGQPEDHHLKAMRDQVFHPGHGHWTIADSQLSVEQSRCDRTCVDQRLAKILSLELRESSSNQSARELIAIAKSTGATSSRCESGVAWTIENSGLIVRLITSEGESPRLLAALFAIQDGRDWQLTTLEPRRGQHQNLLPLLEGAQTTCTRQSDQGRLQLQLIRTNHLGVSWLQLWKSQGWTVRPTEWGETGIFSYLCERDGEVIYAWSVGGEGERNLMLTVAGPNDPGTADLRKTDGSLMPKQNNID